MFNKGAKLLLQENGNAYVEFVQMSFSLLKMVIIFESIAPDKSSNKKRRIFCGVFRFLY